MRRILCSAALAAAFALGGSNYAKAGFFDPGATIADQSVTLDLPSGDAQHLPNIVVPGYVILVDGGNQYNDKNWGDVVEFYNVGKNDLLYGRATQFDKADFSSSLIDDIMTPGANITFLDETTLGNGDLGALYTAGDASYTIENPCSPPPAVPLPLAALMAPAAAGVAAFFGRKLRRLA